MQLKIQRKTIFLEKKTDRKVKITWMNGGVWDQKMLLKYKVNQNNIILQKKNSEIFSKDK